MVLFVELDLQAQSYVAVCDDDRVIMLTATTLAEADAEADALDEADEMLYDEL